MRKRLPFCHVAGPVSVEEVLAFPVDFHGVRGSHRQSDLSVCRTARQLGVAREGRRESRNIRLDGRPDERRDQRPGASRLGARGDREADPRTGQQQVEHAAEKGDELPAPVLLALGQSHVVGLDGHQHVEEGGVDGEPESSLRNFY